MNSRPLVSAIIIFLNGERFIEEAIESVFAQTYDNWELLLVDDGSTDGSTQIALRCAEQHPGKVHYLEHPGHQNRGMSASRNLGLSHAEGEYVAFLDADDVWLSHALEQQVAVFDSYPEAGMIYGPTQVWYSWTGSTEDSQRDFRTLVGKEGDAKLDTLLEPPTGLLNKLLQPLAPPESLVPSICSVLLRREVVKSVGGWEEEFQGLFEDQVLYIKVGLQAPVFVASGCWSRYRQHPNSSWNISLKTGQRHPARVFFFNWIAEYLYEQGVEDVETWKLLQEAQLGAHSKQLAHLKRESDRKLARLKRESDGKLARPKRDSEKERKKVNKRLAQLERNVKEQRRKTRRLRRLLQKTRNIRTQNRPNLWLRKLSKKVGRLRAAGNSKNLRQRKTKTEKQRDHDRELVRQKRKADRELARQKRESDGKLARQKRDSEKEHRKVTKQLAQLKREVKIKTDNSKNLRQHRPKIQMLKNRLYALGFTERALKELQNLATDSSEPTLQSMAAWQLSLWYADQHSEEGARQCLELLPVALQGENDAVLLRRAAIVEAECQEALGNIEAAKLAISRALELGPGADLFLARANVEASASARIERFNEALELYGISKISFDASASHPLLDSLRPGQDKQERVEVSGDTKVSVIISAYNAEDKIQTALDSVLSQTWTNLEVLVVDDCSTDATVRVVEDYVRRDSRVQLIRAESNGGAYVARNLALRVATGAFVTCHDADDWSHPEKIEKQVRHLLNNPLVVGNTSHTALATSDLRFTRLSGSSKAMSSKGMSSYISDNPSSFMFRREAVMEAVGYWDCVRLSGDMEYIMRVKKVLGDESVVSELTEPLSFYRQSSSSLTGSEEFGFHGVIRGILKEYKEGYNHFHDTAENLRYGFPQDSRPFAVPEPMWPTREVKRGERRQFDVIIVSDFRLPAGTTTSNAEEIKAQKQMGLRTGLVQMYRYDLTPSMNINQKVRELLDGDQVQMLVYGEKVSCDVLILKHPPILQEWQQFVPDVEAANVHVIVNQTPLRHYGDEGRLLYTISQSKEHLQRYFGEAGVWHPIGPLVREALYQHHEEELAEITLADEDWVELIDVNEWRRESRPPRGPSPRIGRHSRDHDVKWPVDPSELLAVYPDSEEYEVHVLGGAEIARKVLGGIPKNWHVLGFGELHPKDFLSTLDVFVYYTHPDWVEAFGRVIIEAMAVGVPVILPHSYRELFKEAAIYAEPSEVKSNIDRLMADDEYYESQVRVARDYVEKHFGYTVHATRLRKQIGQRTT